LARRSNACTSPAGGSSGSNPLLRYEGFEARPAGIKAMLPHVDDFLPVHNFDSLTALAAALERPQSRGRSNSRMSETPRTQLRTH
jgi:hypothetical protein